jgi:hypothetical protein
VLGTGLPILGTCGPHYLKSYTFLFFDIFACMDPSLTLKKEMYGALANK